MAGRFPLLTDIHVHDALVEALRRAGWDVLRAVDLLPSNADDEVLFAYAAEHGRVNAFGNLEPGTTNGSLRAAPPAGLPYNPRRKRA